MRNMQWQEPAPPVPMKVIRGTLVINNPEATNETWNRSSLNLAFKEHSMQYMTTSNSSWEEDAVRWNVLLPVDGSQDTPENFLNALNKVIQTDAAKRLDLTGYFHLIYDTGDAIPDVFKVRVDKGEVSYSEAHLTWPEVTFMTPPITLEQGGEEKHDR